MAVEGAFSPQVPVFQHLGRTEEQREWLAALPGLVAELEQRWRVTTGAPFSTGTSSWVAPATTEDGRRAVLKIAWPHPEAREEAAGLRVWAGDGAVQLYAADEPRYALLVERCEPGIPLSDVDLAAEDALLAAGQLIRRLWTATPPDASTFDSVGEVTSGWARLVRERMERHRPPFDPGLVARGADLLEWLPRTATRSVLVHGDINPGNILSAVRQPWLAIDAKPMVGDPGYDPAPLLAQIDPPFVKADPARVLRHRYELFAEIVGEPAERLLAWAVARWVESALWNVSGDDLPTGEEDMAEAGVLARLATL
jgi:streptomycin 6-kinase